MKCNRIPGNKTFTHQTDWKWTNHRLAWVRKAKNQPTTELRVAMPLQSSRRYQNESKVTLKLPSDMKENDTENDIQEISTTSEVQEMEITTETPFSTELLETETELPDITTLKSQTEFKGTTELPDPPEFSTQTENTIKAKNTMEEMTTEATNLELEANNSVQKAAKMTHEEDVKNKEKIAVATVLREEEEEEGAKAEKEKMSAVLQQNSDKEQKILQASSLAIPQKQQQQQQSNEEIPENSLKNNENSRKKENLKEDKSVRPLTTEATAEVVIEKEFFNATDALQEEKDVTIEEQRIGVEVAAFEASEAAEANTKKVVKESEKEILHTSTEKTTEKQFNYAETKVKVEQNPRRMFQGWRYRLQTILRTLEEEARLKKRIQDEERKDFEKQQQKKSTSHKLLRTTVASSAATSRRPSPPPARSQQEATDEVEAIQIDSSWQRQQEPKDLSTTLTLPFTTQEILGKILN